MGKFKELTIDAPVPAEPTNQFIPRTIRGIRQGSSIERMVYTKSEWIIYWDEFRRMGFEVEEFS